MSRSASNLNQNYDSEDEDDDFNPVAVEDSDAEHERDDEAHFGYERYDDAKPDKRRLDRDGDGNNRR